MSTEERGVINLQKEKFVMVPRRVIETQRFGRPYEKLVYTVLMMYADNEQKRSYPSHKRIAELCGCSVRSVQNALKTLSDEGLIEVKARYNEKGDRTSNQYFLLEIPEDF